MLTLFVQGATRLPIGTAVKQWELRKCKAPAAGEVVPVWRWLRVVSIAPKALLIPRDSCLSLLSWVYSPGSALYHQVPKHACGYSEQRTPMASRRRRGTGSSVPFLWHPAGKSALYTSGINEVSQLRSET